MSNTILGQPVIRTTQKIDHHRDFCADPVLQFILDRLHLPPIAVPILLGLAITLLELAWAIPNHLVVGRVISHQKVIGIFDDPAFYLSNWIVGGAIWMYYAWMPGGIRRMFDRLATNGVIRLEGESDQEKWNDLIRKARRILGNRALIGVTLLLALGIAFTLYMPNIQTRGWAGQSLYGRILVTLWISAAIHCISQIVIRQVIVTGLLAILFQRFRVNIRPLHPDKAGGLAPLGNFALKSTYLIMVIGFVIVFAGFNRNYRELGYFGEFKLDRDLIAAGFAYLIFAPLAFLAPLATAHKAMKEAKDELQLILARTFEETYLKIYKKLENPNAGTIELERLEDVQKLHQITDRFPVYPFNTETIRRFCVSVFAPVFLAILPSLITLLFKIP